MRDYATPSGEGHADVASASSKLEGQHQPLSLEARIAASTEKEPAKQTPASDPVKGAADSAPDRERDVPHHSSGNRGAATREEGSRLDATAAPGGGMPGGEGSSVDRIGDSSVDSATAIAGSPAVARSGEGRQAHESVSAPSGGMATARDAGGGEIQAEEDSQGLVGSATDGRGRGTTTSEIEADDMEGDAKEVDEPPTAVKGARVSTSEIEEDLGGPISPTSAFAAQDDGHVTEAVGEDQLKGGATAIALSRMRSFGEGEIEGKPPSGPLSTPTPHPPRHTLPDIHTHPHPSPSPFRRQLLLGPSFKSCTGVLKFQVVGFLVVWQNRFLAELIFTR
jgi:hypothetical protein